MIQFFKNDDYSTTTVESPLHTKHVVLRNVGNYLMEYEASMDFSFELKTIEMKCVGLIKPKSFFSEPRYTWDLHVTFENIPEEGELIIRTWKDYDKDTTGNVITVDYL